jgi:endogenous inhibitor of DNA gyrase (YacG/DUF329 family)
MSSSAHDPPANDNRKALRQALQADSPSTEVIPAGRPCPICQKPSIADYRPFCSKRCADVDLARWLGGTYVIPAESSEEDEFAPKSGGDEDHL